MILFIGGLVESPGRVLMIIMNVARNSYAPFTWLMVEFLSFNIIKLDCINVLMNARMVMQIKILDNNNSKTGAGYEVDK